MSKYLEFLYRHYVVIVGIIGVACVTASVGLFSLTITSDTRVFFADNDPHLLQLESFEKTYSQNNNVLFVLSSKNDDLITQENLKVLAELTRDAWQLPHSIRVDSLTNFPHIETIDDEFILSDLVATPENLGQAELEKIRRVAKTDPLLVNRLISEDLRTAGVNVNFQLPRNGSQSINEVNQAVGVLKARFEEAHPSFEIHATGNVILMQAFSKAALSDIRLLLPVSMAFIVIILLITLRSMRETIVLATLLALSAALATSILGWISLPLNIATVVAPVIIMTLAIASGIHILTSMHRFQRQGVSKIDAITLSFEKNVWPIFLTSLTTIIGFLSMNLADAPPFQQLGNLVISGIGLNLIFTFTLLPLLLRKFAGNVRPQIRGKASGWFPEFVISHRLAILILGSIAIGASALGMTRINLDDDFIRYFDEKFAYRQASDFAEDHLTGLNLVEFDLATGEDDGIFDPDYQRDIARFTTWLRAQPDVVNVSSIVYYTQKLHENLSRSGEASIPDDRTQIAQYYLLLDMGLPEGRSLSDIISTDQSSSRVTAILRKASSGDIRRLNDAASDWIKLHMSVQETSGISINVLFSHLSINNIRSMISGTILSFVAISIVIMLLMRNLTYGLVSLVANSIPALVGFGLWGFLFGTVNLGASVLVAMTLGIVVDDTIHFLSAYQERRRAAHAPREAAATAIRTIGPAMVITTLSLICGFGVLSLSGFDVNRTLGMFTAIIISVALLVDLLLLPAILTWVDQKSRG